MGSRQKSFFGNRLGGFCLLCNWVRLFILSRFLGCTRNDILLCSFRFIRFSKKHCPSVLPVNLRFLVELAKWRGGAKLISNGEDR